TVFCIPVAEELDLKSAASLSGNKKVELIHVKELLPLTGYIRGGCSPIGMKKFFSTFLDETAMLFDTILFSGGRIGFQVEMNPEDLRAVIPFEYADLCD
ncbi:MAG: aminoacyl-tRNA deacylase, partial [Erysipelotrichaceae bacterium]|nr:aminoacyl-tRNA deacylase [Erysipelotrichaceae bacterium]